MKKKITAFVSVILTVQMLAVLFSASASAEESDYTENGVRYKLLSDKTAVVVGCDEGVSDVTISDTLKNGCNVESIGSEAFQGNLELTSFICEADIGSVGDYAFESCAHLKTASFKGNVEKIGKSAFAVCSSLNTVELPDSVNEIGDGAFLMDNVMNSFDFPSELASLGRFAFAFSGLRKADMNCNMTSIPDRAFFRCANLTEVKMPSGTVSIGDHAFSQCEMLSSAVIPASVDVIGNSAFQSTVVSDLDLHCSTIGDYAFSGCYEMKNISFSDDLKNIGKHAFSNMTVDKFVLPDSAVVSDDSLTVLNTDGFEVSETNPEYTVKDGVLFSKDMKKLIAYPCRDDSENSVYTVPDGVEVIAANAFNTAWSLTEVKLPDSVREIGEAAFRESGLKKIKLPASVKTIKKDTFASCQSFESVDLGKVEKIEDGAFKDCSVFNLKLPETVNSIDPRSFMGSDIRLDASGSYKTVDGVLFTADGKTLVYYPKYLEDEAYRIPDGVESVSDYAFVSNASVKCVYIPGTLSDLGEYSIGYTSNTYSGYEQLLLTDGFVIIGNAQDGVKNYARNNNIGIFTDAALSQTISDVSLEGKATAKFLINNTDPADVVYTSNDSRIASVSSDGTITGISKGTTYVTAAVGTTYFKCKVTVTSDSGIEYKGFDESKYVKVNQDTYSRWVEDYKENNPYLTKHLDGPNSSLAVSAYQSQSYFESMFGADAPESHYHDSGINMFGEGFDDMIKALSHACDAELSRYHNTDNMLLYSGADYYTTGLVTQGKPATVANMRSSVGASITYPLFTSTTLDEIVSHRFYGGQDGVLMMIYADKNALDHQHAGYIGAYHGDIEYELLISHGAKFEVIDAGVRYVSREGFREDDEKLDTYERYVKLKLLPDESETASSDVSTDSEKPGKSTDSEKETSSARSESAASGKTNDSAVSSKHSESRKSDSAVSSAKSSSTDSKKNTSSNVSKTVSSKKTESRKSVSSAKSNASKASSDNTIRRVLTGDNTSHIVFLLAVIMTAAASAVILARRKDS